MQSGGLRCEERGLRNDTVVVTIKTKAGCEDDVEGTIEDIVVCGERPSLGKFRLQAPEVKDSGDRGVDFWCCDLSFVSPGLCAGCVR